MDAVFVTAHGGPEVLELRQVPEPVPGEGEVVVKAWGSSINAADIKARQGSYHLGATPPFVPGLDTFGTVAAVGPNVTNVSIGDNVVAFTQSGSYSEYVLTRDVLTFKVNEPIELAKAAALPIASFTAYNILSEIARIRPGETVLIQGASGGVGVFCIQIAKLLGAKTVIGTTTRKEKTPALRKLGCDVVVDSSEEDFVETVKEVTQGYGVNIAIDSFGTDVLSKTLQCTSRYGRVVSIGASNGKSTQIDVGHLYSECKSLIGYSFGTVRKHNPEHICRTVDQIFQWVSKNELNVPVHATFPLLQAAAAQEVFESHDHIGKIVLTMN